MNFFQVYLYFRDYTLELMFNIYNPIDIFLIEQVPHYISEDESMYMLSVILNPCPTSESYDSAQHCSRAAQHPGFFTRLLIILLDIRLKQLTKKKGFSNSALLEHKKRVREWLFIFLRLLRLKQHTTTI